MIYEERKDLEEAVQDQTGFVQVRGHLIHKLAEQVDLGDNQVDKAIAKAMKQSGDSRRPSHLTIECCKRLLDVPEKAAEKKAAEEKTASSKRGNK